LSDFLVGYRDPLFGLIVFFALIFIISFFSYWWAIYKTKEQNSRLSRFFNRFEIKKESDDTYLAQLHMAEALAMNGDYEEAIGIYSKLKDAYPHKRIELLKMMGDLYKKAGFLARSKEIYEEILGIFPRHKEVLRSLLVLNEKLGDLDGAFDVLESLEELEDMGKERGYLEAKLAAQKGDVQRLIKLYNAKRAKRAAIEPLFRLDHKRAWQTLREEDVFAVIDILWQLPKERISTHLPLLQELYSAKGYVKEAKESKHFALDLLLHYDKADLEFEYLCTHCKKRFPLPFLRCPACLKVEDPVVEISIVEKRGVNEKSVPF